MAITTYRILGNPTNTLPFSTTNGQIITFNQSTGDYTWMPNPGVYGNFLNEFTYELLCDGIVIDTGVESFNIPAPTSCTYSFVYSSCNPIVSYHITLLDVIEPNRLISGTSTSISFTILSSVNNYLVTMIDNLGITRKVILRNLKCL